VMQNQRLFEVARGMSSLARFLDEFGHRAASEMELAQPRWRERPEVVQRMVDGMRRMRHSPKELHATQAAAREKADSELGAALASVGGATFEPRIRRDLQFARTLLPYRESGKFQWMRAVETLRQSLEEVARRTQLGDDLYFLRRDELAGLASLAGAAVHADIRGSERDGNEIRRRIAERKLSHAAAKTLQLPEAIDSRCLERLGDADDRESDFGELGELDRFDEEAAKQSAMKAGEHNSRGNPPRQCIAVGAVATDVSSKRTLRARAISSGRVVGVARRVFDPNDEVELGDDFILVCPSTDPGWTPLLVRAAGLIVERGGALSHGAIVARDFGLPAVACEAATRRIPDGARIELDARRGLVTLLDDAESATPVDGCSDGTIAGRST
ncbi:MAG TPA: PEP-utilizing enzyme, partial [Pirellulaceae bacterium]|nr:PEP-utilizing enzyme [Pirellulaceae bacterium]